MGLLTGSFLNVCIYRIPRDISLWWPRSFCPRCGRTLRIQDLVPVISFGLRRGRGRCCGESISWRYPVIELLTACGFVLLAFRTGPGWQLIPRLILFGGLVAASAIDLELRIIPNRLLFWMVAVFAVIYSLLPVAPLINHLAGALAAFLMLLPAYLVPGSMGGGDMKLAAVIGLYLGWPLGVLAIFIAILTGALGGMVWATYTGANLKAALPFAPFLSIGGIAAMLRGAEILSWYQGFF